MTILQMRYFDSVVRNKSVTKAAEELFVSQSGISKSLIELEKEYNLNLFNRENNHLNLTENGIYFWEKISKILHDIDSVSLEMKHKGEKQNLLNIGIPPMIGTILLPKIFSEFYQNSLGTQINILEGGTVKTFEALKKNEINIGFIIREKDDTLFDDNEINILPLMKTKLVYSVGPNHKFSRLKKISLQAIGTDPIILLKNGSYLNTKIPEYFKKNNLTPNIKLYSDQLNVLKTLLLDDELGTFFIEKFMEKEKNIVSIEISPNIEIEILLVWKKSFSSNPTFKDFLEIIKKIEL